MNSALYEGWVRHRRRAPADHAFRYRLCLVYLDLDEVDDVTGMNPMWSSKGPALARMRRSDFLGDPNVPLRDAVADRVEQKLGRRPTGPIRLLANLRYFGFSFNPVSFYYCYEPDGRTLDAIVAEITNTPWGERHAYVLDARSGVGNGRSLRFGFAKSFHVSPFMPMDLGYDWRLTPPDERLLTHMALIEGDEEVFDATMALRRRSISAKSLTGLLVRFPFMTLRILAAIYWQALRLWLKSPIPPSSPQAPCRGRRYDMTQFITHTPAAESSRRSGVIDDSARRLVEARLERFRGGELAIVDDSGARRVFGSGEPSVTISVHDRRFYRDLLTRGELGAADAFVRGDWDVNDLTTLFRLMLRDQEATDGLTGPAALAASLAARLGHWRRRNSRTGSRRNILAHYDLGNDFYALFLDETMAYSCGIFEAPDSTLRDASRAKFDRLCRRLRLQPGDHVLEIGCGWGGFAMHAARYYECTVTAATISDQQYDLAQRRVAEAGLSDRVRIIKCDYRDLDGAYDHIVSIEMIEAVGHEFLPKFFSVCRERLREGGTLALQAITMPDHRYAQYRRSVDFIRAFVFPGSCVPSVSALTNAAARGSDLRLIELEDIGPHYATTLAHWRARFLARLDDVRALGYTDPFIRLWLYYLSYCEAGFSERYLGDVQAVFARPGGPRSADG